MSSPVTPKKHSGSAIESFQFLTPGAIEAERSILESLNITFRRSNMRFSTISEPYIASMLGELKRFEETPSLDEAQSIARQIVMPESRPVSLEDVLDIASQIPLPESAEKSSLQVGPQRYETEDFPDHTPANTPESSPESSPENTPTSSTESSPEGTPIRTSTPEIHTARRISMFSVEKATLSQIRITKPPIPLHATCIPISPLEAPSPVSPQSPRTPETPVRSSTNTVHIRTPGSILKVPTDKHEDKCLGCQYAHDHELHDIFCPNNSLADEFDSYMESLESFEGGLSESSLGSVFTTPIRKNLFGAGTPGGARKRSGYDGYESITRSPTKVRIQLPCPSNYDFRTNSQPVHYYYEESFGEKFVTFGKEVVVEVVQIFVTVMAAVGAYIWLTMNSEYGSRVVRGFAPFLHAVAVGFVKVVERFQGAVGVGIVSTETITETLEGVKGSLQLY